MEPFMGLIAAFGFNFAPRGWALCQGQIMNISQNSALYALLGTMYGGNGSQTFGLPDLRGRVIIGMGQGPGLQNYIQGQLSGTENSTLAISNMPAHNHVVDMSGTSVTIKASTSTALSNMPGGRNTVLSATDGAKIYGITTPDTPLNVGGGAVAGAVNVSVIGGNAPFSNMQPYCPLNMCIATEGIFPSRN